MQTTIRLLVVVALVFSILGEGIVFSESQLGTPTTPISPGATPAVPATQIPTQQPTSATPTGGSQGFWPPDWSQFWPTLLGAALGLLSGMWLNRRAERRQKAQEAAQRVQRQIHVLRLLEDELGRNQRSLTQVKSDLQTDRATAYTVTLDIWRALPQEIFESLRDTDHAQAVIDAYDHLGQVARLLALYDSLVATGGDGLHMAREEYLPRLTHLLDQALQKAVIAERSVHAEARRGGNS